MSRVNNCPVENWENKFLNYLKYYFIEDYLFREVRKNFKNNGYLSPEEFFCIIIWKSNRAKTAIKRKLLKLGSLRGIVRKLTSEIFHATGTKQKLELLIKDYKFSLPMASAILTVLYPDDFTVYDVSVRRQLKIRDFAGRQNQIERYFAEFLPSVKKIQGKSLRNKDRYLWGKSFYEDLMEFLEKVQK